MAKTETICPLDVNVGDILYVRGYRVVASEVGREEKTVARYTLHSAPNEAMPKRLPTGYEGMRSGGNQWVDLTREVR